MKDTVNVYAHGLIKQAWFDLVSKEFGIEIEIQVSQPFTGGYFIFNYECLMEAAGDRFRQRVNCFKRLAELSNTELLTDDEDINPYQYIYFNPGESATSVIVDPDAIDQRNELTVDYFYSPGWGSFSVERPLSANQEEWIKKKFSSKIPLLELGRVDSSIFDSYFQAARKEIHALKHFEYYYMLRPPEKSTWYSKMEKAAFVTDSLFDFHREHDMRICVFPVNSSVIENIPGGSDSEISCILLEDLMTNKIIYKQRRKSW